MIPKIIHYCWISENMDDELPEKVRECINTWKKYLPDYEIKRWNQYNFDISNSVYAKQALVCKKYAFVSDYIRLAVLYKYGGIYLDTDMKVLRSFNELLNNEAFIGFESKYSIAAGIIGAEKKHNYIKILLDLYEDKEKVFIKNDGSLDMTPNPVIITNLLLKKGIKLNNILQKNDKITVYPKEYFYAYDGVTKEMNITDNTFAVHLYAASWAKKEDILWHDTYGIYYKKIKSVMPEKISKYIAGFLTTYKFEGIRGIIKKYKKHFMNNKEKIKDK